MAFRTWGRLLLTALGVSVLAGAGQLGVAYGFGIVRLTGAFTGTTVNQWPAQLVWVGWFAANAAVAGAVLTGRLAHRDAPAASTSRQLAVGGAAALGATVIAPLCMQPARAAELISVDPVWAVGICAVVGAVIGAGAAIAVLLRPELGWNMAAVAGAVWLLALISVLPSLGTAGPLPTVRLGVLEPSWLDDAAAQRLALLLLPTVALLAGAATAGLARWRGQPPLVSGATGVAGPVLVAFAYLTAGPGDAVDRYQATPYYGALIAILAGALGAAAAALLRWPVTRAADPQTIEPTAILRPLPAGPALPSAASGDDRDTAERTDSESANAALSTGAQRGGVVAGPRAVGEPDGVRTVPAHWDWPETTASGQHGPTPAAPAQPAAWLTAPTGEFTAAGQTSSARRDDVPATTEPSTSADVSHRADVSDRTDATPTSAAAGRVDAAAATDDRAVDEPIGSTATGTTSSDATSSDTGRTAGTTAAPTSTDSGTGGGADNGTSGTEAAGATGTEAAGHATPEAPRTIRPRRTRKSKANPDATASEPADDTSPAGSATTDAGATESAATTDETPTGPARKGSRSARSAGSSTGPDAATDAPAPGRGKRSGPTTEVASGTAAAGTAAKRAPATAASEATQVPADPESPSTPAETTEAPTGVTPAPATTTGAKRTPALPTSTGHSGAEAAAAPHVPKAGPDVPKAGLDSSAAPTGATSSTSDSATAGAGGTDSARSAVEGVPTAGLFGVSAAGDSDADLWTPAPSAWPVTSTWAVPPHAAEPGPTASEGSSGSGEPSGSTPRPRHRPSLPDLSQAGTWNAFDTSRRARSTRSQDSSTAAEASPTTPAAEPPGSPGSPGTMGAPAAASTTSDSTASDSGTGEVAATEVISTPPKVAEQPSRRGRLGGLFRRNRSRADEESPKTSDDAEPLATQDEEFVDWVAGLSKPVSDNEPERENGRRSLRSTGRHHRD
ncbi:hypothetical protein [Micromonospora violae]|nr:hypothetical protein [Micromonospora violae]